MPSSFNCKWVNQRELDVSWDFNGEWSRMDAVNVFYYLDDGWTYLIRYGYRPI